METCAVSSFDLSHCVSEGAVGALEILQRVFNALQARAMQLVYARKAHRGQCCHCPNIIIQLIGERRNKVTCPNILMHVDQLIEGPFR